MSFIINPYRHAGGANGLLTGLVSYYKLDETSGTTVFDAHGSNDGTRAGNVSVNSTGIIDKCYNFYGSNVPDGQVSFGDINALEGIDTLTVSAWIKRDTVAVSDVAGDAIASKWQGGASWILYQTSNQATAFLIIVGGVFYGAVSPNSTTDTNWHHIVGRYDGSEVSLWVDGVKQAITSSITGNIDSGNGLVQLGTYQRNNDWFDGLIDEVGLWDTDLSDSQIATLYNSGSGLSYDNFTS